MRRHAAVVPKSGIHDIHCYRVFGSPSALRPNIVPRSPRRAVSFRCPQPRHDDRQMELALSALPADLRGYRGPRRSRLPADCQGGVLRRHLGPYQHDARLPIASGIIEGACGHLVQDCLNLAGATCFGGGVGPSHFSRRGDPVAAAVLVHSRQMSAHRIGSQRARESRRLFKRYARNNSRFLALAVAELPRKRLRPSR